MATQQQSPSKRRVAGQAGTPIGSAPLDDNGDNGDNGAGRNNGAGSNNGAGGKNGASSSAIKNGLKAVSGFLPIGASSNPKDYELPIIHAHMSEKTVNLGFWGALAGTAVLGIVDAPLAVLIGAGVIIARHRANGSRPQS